MILFTIRKNNCPLKPSFSKILISILNGFFPHNRSKFSLFFKLYSFPSTKDLQFTYSSCSIFNSLAICFSKSDNLTLFSVWWKGYLTKKLLKRNKRISITKRSHFGNLSLTSRVSFKRISLRGSSFLFFICLYLS